MNVFRPLALLLVVMSMAALARAEEPDWTTYGVLLGRFVSVGEKNGVPLNMVDYSALLREPDFIKVAKQIETFDPGLLTNKNERLAFYINAYNVLAIKMVLDNWPVTSIKEAGGFFEKVWDKPVGKVGGAMVTLGHVEHEILRPMKDPRIHFAIVCASVSCPDLRREPYTAQKLDDQLGDQIRSFLKNPAKGFRNDRGTIRVSKIFNWFEGDFEKSGGIQGFISNYHNFFYTGNIETDLPYDWALNGF